MISMSFATRTPSCRSFPMSLISGSSGRFLSCEFTHAVYACVLQEKKTMTKQAARKNATAQ